MEALRKRAAELDIPLEIALPLEHYNLGSLKLGLQGEHQRMNAALAVALCRGWAERSGPQEHKALLNEALEKGTLPDSYIQGLAETKWAGRGQVVRENRISFYLDGAHSPESMEACAKWFASAAKAEMLESSSTEPDANSSLSAFDIKESFTRPSGSRQILLFNCMPKRDPNLLLPPLTQICAKQEIPLQLAIFVPPYSSYTSIDSHERNSSPDLSWQKALQQHWESLTDPAKTPGDKTSPELFTGLKNGSIVSSSILGASSAVMPSLPVALDWLRLCSARHPSLHLQVLVTGSLYLVGDVLRLVKH